MPSAQAIVQILATLPLCRLNDTGITIISKHTSRYVTRNGRKIARLVKVHVPKRRALVAMGRIWPPKRLVLIGAEIEARNIDMVYKARPQKPSVHHSVMFMHRRVSKREQTKLSGAFTYVSTLNNPQAVRRHEMSMSLERCSDEIRGPLLFTNPRLSPIRMASCSMIYPRSSFRDMAYLV